MPRSPKPAQLRLVPLADAAAYGRVCKTTLRNWIAAGLIEGHRRGPKLLFIDLDDIDKITQPVTIAR